MNIITFFRYLKEKKIKRKTKDQLRIYNNKLVKEYPNVAIFAFDDLATKINIYGIHEKELLEGLKFHIFKKIDSSNSVCIDVGANVGNHSLYFSQFFNKVYSFEPHPEIFELLKFNVRKNKNVNIFNFGLSNKNKEMKIGNDTDTSCGSSYMRDNSNFRCKDIFDTQVKIFDDFFNDINEKKKISFIKIDVEGSEFNVLQGMKKILKKLSPIICLEQNHKEFNKFGKNISTKTINFLKDNKYFYYYEISPVRDWRYTKNTSLFIAKIIKFVEAAFFGVPELKWKLIKIDKFSKRTYNGIIVSKTLIE